MEALVAIESIDARLEGCLNRKNSEKAVVVTHPHPLYGGNMDNHVVCRMAAAFQSVEISTLRFNFRGTGGSSGEFDNGEKEQEDVLSALDFLSGEGFEQILLAGYSFGAWVNAHVVCNGAKVADHIMVSPPAAFLSFDQVACMPHTGLIITGEKDDISPPPLVNTLVSRWNIPAKVMVIDNGDHFYGSVLDGLGNILTSYLNG